MELLRSLMRVARDNEDRPWPSRPTVTREERDEAQAQFQVISRLYNLLVPNTTGCGPTYRR
ncbi:hypothetical protein D5400_20645 [Georhizobium profundi]|uniref:Uncharacterized protein n=1 Tax=Georhizobium profundi TaxID=2341112 RepID=A0A3S9B8R3_9HYPH|nr:hypothetical protein D5400_20645 [Georhizobium profundi]